MKSLIGYTLIFSGIILGIYVGFWVMFVGGIMDLIETVRAETLIKMDVFIGIMKMVLAGMVGVIIATTGIYLGTLLTEKKGRLL
jgi:hypothetical protein